MPTIYFVKPAILLIERRIFYDFFVKFSTFRFQLYYRASPISHFSLLSFSGEIPVSYMDYLFLVGFNMSCEFLVCCHQYNIGQDIRTWDIVFAISSMAIYLTCVKTEIPKLLFIYTLVVDYIMIVRGIAIFLDIQFFRGPGISYRFLGTPVDTIIRLIPLVVTAPLCSYFWI